MRLAATALVLSLVAVACSSAHAPTPLSISHCGFVYTLRASGGATHIGSCAGSLSATAQQVTVRAGQTFEIDSVTEAATGLPDMNAPVSSDPAVVALVRVFGQGGNGKYRAIAAGAATLVTSTIYCNGGPVDPTATTRPGSPRLRVCPVVRVQVTG